MNTEPSQYRSWDAIVFKRYVEPSGPTQSVDPLLERYDLVAVNTDDNVQLTNHLPIRRISRGAKIIPAQVGDPAKIVFNGTDYFAFMLTEGIPFREGCP